MSEPYIGEIRMFGGSFAPVGYMPCDGRLLSIDQYTALFSLLGTTYGGDGEVTFGLPDLRGRHSIGAGFSQTGLGQFVVGDSAGAESVTLITAQLPPHAHGVVGSSAAPDSGDPSGRLLATTGRATPIYGSTFTGTMKASMVGATGGNQPIPILAPSLTINFIIATEGVYPSF
jgi:microcystin-dependent protein